MPKFAYSAIDSHGATVEGTVKGDTIGTARSILLGKELHPVKIAEKKGALSIELTKEKLKKRELMHFSRQLSVFIRAGIPIIDSLETIAEEAQDKVLRRTIEDMCERLRGGSTFADAARAHTEAFPPFYLGILGSAEVTGNLDTVLDQLADYIDRELEAKAKVIQALVYPVIVMSLSFVTVAILAGYVLPQFKTLFTELDAELPLPTRMLLAVATFVTDYWWVLLILFILFVAWLFWMQSVEVGRNFRDKLLLKLPAAGDIVRYSVLERFCRILSSMVSAGVPLPEAMKVTTDATNNYVYRKGLEQAREAMIQGAGFTKPLNETGLFPGAARQMFRVGEETGTLDEQLAVAAVYFDRELDIRIKRFTALFEPLMIVVVGVIVGFVAIALVSAMYGVLGGVKDQNP
jgi:type IV pilus assembly protein PilC